jgi:hypothetical protein
MSAIPGGGILLQPTPLDAVRRTTTTVVVPDGTWAAGQRVTAVGRDLARSARGALRSEHDWLSFAIDAEGLLVPDEHEAGHSVPEALRGHSAQRGLRKRVAELRPGDAALGREGGLFDTLLDDVVGTSLASGYGALYEGSNASRGSEISTSMRMTCVGFSTLHRQGEEFDVLRYFETKPRSVEFVPDDILAWHQDVPMEPNTFRRRRMLQVARQPESGASRTGGSVSITGYFRDTFMRPDGVEMVVHEYGLDATASGLPLVLDQVEAVPGNLPLQHCPRAARTAVRLGGLRLADVEPAVRHDLTGAAGCTHLNDELRALRLAPTLLAALA